MLNGDEVRKIYPKLMTPKSPELYSDTEMALIRDTYLAYQSFEKAAEKLGLTLGNLQKTIGIIKRKGMM